MSPGQIKATGAGARSAQHASSEVLRLAQEIHELSYEGLLAELPGFYRQIHSGLVERAQAPPGVEGDVMFGDLDLTPGGQDSDTMFGGDGRIVSGLSNVDLHIGNLMFGNQGDDVTRRRTRPTSTSAIASRRRWSANRGSAMTRPKL